jgi:hypothetical protein
MTQNNSTDKIKIYKKTLKVRSIMDKKKRWMGILTHSKMPSKLTYFKSSSDGNN